MAEQSGFFNSSNGDRKYKAEFFAKYFATFIGNGVFPNPSTNLQVIANNNMTVTVKAGTAWINGYVYFNDSDLILPISVADGVLNRIDRIVLQYSTVDRTITAKVKKGTFAGSPVAPSLQRDADAYELGLADIAVNKGAVSISQANITDLRLNTGLCGIVHGTIEQADTTTLFNQYQSWFNNTKNTSETEINNMEAQFQSDFNTWFNTVKNTLGSDAAGNLLNQINALAGEGRTTETVKGNADAIASLSEEFASHSAENVQQFNAINIKLTDYNSYANSADANGIYTVVDYKRADGTLYMKSTLSGGTSPNYTIDTWQFYNDAGSIIIATKTWTFTYDIDGKITSKVVV